MNDTYEIYAVKYAHHGPRMASLNFIGGDPHETSHDLDFYVWAVFNKDRTIVVDTGFDETMAKRRDRTILKPVASALAAAGIAPEKVDDVIITHLHYDHSGNYDAFPNARYHLQDCEMDFATGRCMCDEKMRVAFEADDVTALVRKVFAGRVAYHDGDEQLAPGISVHHIGGHSKGLQAVKVKTARGDVVLASDGVHLYEHLDQNKVFPITYSADDAVAGYAKLRKLAPSVNHIIPGHDPAVLQRYPAPTDALKGWVARLDAEPTL
ncbi:MAG: N-acyl homoserine lactonase family protein [Xanthobacteraceae bacterium]